MFFTKFPLTTFKINDNESIVAIDFIKAIKVDPVLKENAFYYTVYQAMDNETPETISHMFYGNTQYHWVIMLLNEKFDAYNDFPKSDEILRKQTINRFGSLDGVHHLEYPDGTWADELVPPDERVTVSFYEFMASENENKRQVKVLRKELLAEFTDTYYGLIRE